MDEIGGVLIYISKFQMISIYIFLTTLFSARKVQSYIVQK